MQKHFCLWWLVSVRMEFRFAFMADRRHPNRIASSWNCNEDLGDTTVCSSWRRSIGSIDRIYNSSGQRIHPSEDMRSKLKREKKDQQSTSNSQSNVQLWQHRPVKPVGHRQKAYVPKAVTFSSHKPPFWQRPATHRPGVPMPYDQERERENVEILLRDNAVLPTISQFEPEYPIDRRTELLLSTSIHRLRFSTIRAWALYFDAILIGRHWITDATIGTHDILAISCS